MAWKNIFVGLLSVLVIALGALYQQSPLIRLLLDFSEHELTDNSACTAVPGTEACEKIVLHHESGLLYMACSTVAKKRAWDPFSVKFEDRSGTTDYIAFYDPKTREITRLNVSSLADSRGLHVHGLDVVQSESDPSTLWVYVVNHRPQLEAGSEYQLGTSEAIEVFKTTPGGKALEHVKTYDDQAVLILTNDVTGSSDGQSFYFTNYHPSKLGKLENLASLVFATKSTSVGFCHADTGCKIAAKGVIGANGIVRTNDDTIWVATTADTYIRSFSRQADNTLVLAEEVKIGGMVDNLTTDKRGNIYAAVVASEPRKFLAYIGDIKNRISPTATYNISLNTGRSSFFGEKWSVQKIFEDDGSVISASTTSAYDPREGVLYLHGPFSDKLVTCPK
ncbi:calcium-dependent phosphotriesterase [Clavulina sp. PMI_390]|nr:calcium-dependent phosphotriesterase [Clavulina sp. PMI_390]